MCREKERRKGGSKRGGREGEREGGRGRERGREGGRGRERGRQVMKYCSAIAAVEVQSEKEVLEVWLVAPLHQSGHHCSRQGREHTGHSRAVFSEGTIEGLFRGQ